MAKLAYLGPEWTFSHDLARKAFQKDQHIPQLTLRTVVESVANGLCSVGLVPFYNTTRMSVTESQVELVKYAKKVFVTDVLSLDVKHCVGGHGSLRGIREFRTKEVVFLQISEWLERCKLGSAKQVDFPSTSAAVKSLANGEQPKGVAAVGTKSAFREYGVPLLAENIQNKPNVTLFFVIKNKRPDLADARRIVMCLNNPQHDDRLLVEEIVSKCGCNISSNWAVTLAAKPRRDAYFFEINGIYSSLGLASAVTSLTAKLKNVFVLGGYADKCITRLLCDAK